MSWARVSQRRFSRNTRSRRGESAHFPRCTLGPFGTQGNKGSPMVLGNATSMLLAATTSPINKFTSCLMHFWSCYFMFGLFGISACGVPGYLSKHNLGMAWLLVLFCVMGLVLPAAPAAPIQAGRAAGEHSSGGAAAEGKWWHIIWHWWKTEWETCRCVVGDTASYPAMITPQRWSWHSAAF